MKKIIFLVILVVGIFLGYTIYRNNKEANKFIYEDILNSIKDNKAEVTDFAIYGKYLNLKGNFPSSDNYELVFKNNEEEIQIKSFINDFSTSDYINDGINLEKLKTGKYIMLLHNFGTDEYYNLINRSTYHENKYYTMTKDNKNNLITFNEEEWNDIKYWTITIEETKLPDDVYDIVIDPGHGGIDTGASNGNYHESKYTLEYGLALKEALEDVGLKVKLTREDNVKIDHYGVGSRTGIPYETKAKLMLSIHLNSSNSKKLKGVEIYRAYEANDNFAKLISDNIVNYANTTYSINPQNKILDGVYMRTYSESDKASLRKEASSIGYEPYELPDNLTYYYFIRETGGINTKAFSDGRNPKYNANIYRNSNIGTEAYLCELAYISNMDDLKNIINNKESFIKALKESVISYVNN